MLMNQSGRLARLHYLPGTFRVLSHGDHVLCAVTGKTIPLFGVHLPPLVAPDENLAGQLEELHETIGTLGYWLIGLHATAALFHHYVLRDKTLRRMLPVRT